MGFAVAAHFLSLSEDEVSEFQASEKEGAHFGLLRKMAMLAMPLQDEINAFFDSNPDQTAQEFENRYMNGGQRYEFGALSPHLLGLSGTALRDWEDHREAFKREEPELYAELTNVVALLMKLIDSGGNNKKPARISFTFSKATRFDAKYRINTAGGRVRARIRVQGPIFPTFRPDQP